METAISSLGHVEAYSHEGHTLTLDCGGPRVAISALTDRIVRVRVAPDGSFAPRRSWAVAPADDQFPGGSAELERVNGTLLLRTAALTVQISRSPCRISFLDPQGTPFCVDSAGPGWADGGSQITCEKRIEAEEHFYGFGERTGPLDKLGMRMINWTTDHYRYAPGTDPLYIAIPTFMALRPGLAYGVYFNNSWRSSFDMGRSRPGCWLMEAEGGELDYYVVFGPDPAAVCAGLGQILGAPPLPPRWALGYHQSRWSYGSEAQTRELASEFRRRDIPCDAIHLDIDYMDGYRNFTWHPERFPNLPGLFGDLAQDGFHVVPIIDAGVKVDPDYTVYQQGMEQNMFIRRADGEVFHGYVWPDDSVFADYTRPDVRAWWGSMHRPLVEAGAAGIWNDMNEPTVFGLPFSQGGGDPRPIDLDAVQGPCGERSTHAEVHNLYGSGMAQACYEGLRQLMGVRPFVLTRSAFAGIQRWSACWMGDNTSRWEHLEMAMPQLMNMGLSGVAFVGTDIGGFFDNATGELFARWMQLGALMPFSRGHSCADTERHEPWVFGPEIEAICRRYIQLRYRLLPYLYSLFWEASRRTAPVLRPLLYHFPEDTATYQIHDQVLLGPSLMAAPVYQPGRQHRHVYLPAGAWYDWWSDERIKGPANLLAQAPLEKLPLYVRAGAILPSGPALSHTGERPLGPLTLDLYPGSGEFTLYEDDGISFEHERGLFCTTSYRLRAADGRLSLEIGARAGHYAPPQRRLVLRFHDLDEAAAQSLAGATFDAERRIVTLELDDDGQAHRFELPCA